MILFAVEWVLVLGVLACREKLSKDSGICSSWRLESRFIALSVLDN
jgi:hypothetical protein